MKKNTRLYLFAFLLFASGLAYLCVAGFSETGVYFLNVAEAKATTPDKLRQARIFGIVAPAGLEKNLDSVAFRLLDKDDDGLHIPVIYSGLIPDTFKAGAEVIVEGGMNEGGDFIAKILMTKCPSKYQKENRAG